MASANAERALGKALAAQTSAAAGRPNPKEPIIFAIFALIAFVLGLFDVAIGDLAGSKWLFLGLALLSLHLIVPLTPWRRP